MMIKRAYDATKTPLLLDADSGLLKKAYVRDGTSHLASEADIGALPQDMQQFIKNDLVVDTDNFCYMVVNALGDEETYGANVNGDSMPRETHTDGRSPCLSHVGEEHGYKTYELWGHWYNYHKSQKPDFAMGYVPFSSYDQDKGVVIILVAIDRSRDPQTASEVDAGQLPLTSMGLKTPFDICTKCSSMYGTREMVEKWIDEWFNDAGLQEDFNSPGEYVLFHNDKHIAENKSNIPGLARWTKQYCPHIHLSNPGPGMRMNKVDENGLRWNAINHLPKLFDMSKVFVNADKTSMGLVKLASGIFAPANCVVDAVESEGHKPYAPEQYNEVSSPYSHRSRTLYSFLNEEGMGEKTAEMSKDAPSEEKPQSLSPEQIEEAASKVVKSICDSMGPYMDVMDKAGEKEPIPESFFEEGRGRPMSGMTSALKAAKIVPSKQEFQKIFLGKIGANKTAQLLEEKGINFGDFDISEASLRSAERKHGGLINRLFEDGPAIEGCMDKLASIMPMRSLLPVFYFPRVRKTIELVKHAGFMPDINTKMEKSIGPKELHDLSVQKMDMDPGGRDPFGMLETMALAAIAYPLLRNKIVGGAGGKSVLPMITPKQGALIAAAGIGGDALLDWLKYEPAGEPSIKSINNSIAEVKTAGVGEYMPWSKDIGKAYLGALATMPVIHGYSMHQRNRAMRGEQINAINKWIAMNPDIASLGYLAAGPVAARAAAAKAGQLTKMAAANYAQLHSAKEAMRDPEAQMRPSPNAPGYADRIRTAARNTGAKVARPEIDVNPYNMEDRLLSGLTWGLMTPAAFIPSMIGGMVDGEVLHRLLG